MATSNISIINDLRQYLETVSSNNSEKAKYSLSITDFSRHRKLPFRILVLLLLNSLKRSLSIELLDFFSYIKSPECSKQAFSAQRVKLRPCFFRDWNQVLVKSFYLHYGERLKTWRGMKLWAMDGSSVALPVTEELKETFGCPTNQLGVSNPVARISVLYDVLNNLVIQGVLHSYFVSEESASLKCLETQNLEDSLLLFDRGYFSYWLVHELERKNTKFLMRVQKNANNAVKSFLASEQTDWMVNIYPSESSLKRLKENGVEITPKTPLRVRLVKVLLNTGETELLMTNLYDIDTLEDFKEVYNLRWGIETFYGHLKEELQLGQFSGIRAICIEQDFAANLVLFNLQSLIEKQSEPYLKAVSRKRKYSYKVNKNIALAAFKYRVVMLFVTNDSYSILWELQLIFEKHLVPIRPGRKFPRIRKKPPNNRNYTRTNYKRAI